MSFQTSNCNQIEQNLSRTGFVEDAVEEPGGAGAKEVGSNKRLLLVEGEKNRFDIFDARRGVPYERALFLGALKQFLRVAILSRRPGGKSQTEKEKDQ